MKIIGVTGQTGSGKSYFSGLIAKRFGGVVLDADYIAHAVMTRGGEAYGGVIKRFGEEVLNNGEIDRAKLGAVVFGDARALKDLEDIVHPAVINRFAARIEELRENGEELLILDIPLLFEAGMETMCERVVILNSDETTRTQRIIRRDGISEEAAKKRVSARKTNPVNFARECDLVVENEGIANEDMANEIIEKVKRWAGL